MLFYYYCLLANIVIDTAENEPSGIWPACLLNTLGKTKTYAHAHPSPAVRPLLHLGDRASPADHDKDPTAEPLLLHRVRCAAFGAPPRLARPVA